jgi:metallo-beta-lactamase family protein
MIECDGLRVLLDMGMFQGPREESRQLNAWLAEGASRADAVILSHGHLDHCGKLPLLVKSGFAGPIYCTAATSEVARIVLEDAAEIQEEDASYLNQRRGPGEPVIRPIFSRADAHEVYKRWQRVKYGESVNLPGRGGGGIRFTFFDAGHILGSAYVLLECTEKTRTRRVLFTADIGRYDTPIINDPHALEGEVDLLITESTYGDRKHAPMSEVAPQFLEAIRGCIQQRSRLIIPSFAVGRTQTVLHYAQQFIHENQIPQIPIYVDSPMGVEVTRAYEQYREGYDPITKEMIGKKELFALSRITLATSGEQSRQINRDRGPCVIIASSPTCEFGRVLHHLRQSIENPNDRVIFVGWIPPQTLGRRLQDGQKRVRIHDRWYDVRCQVQTIHGLSAHADGDELLRFLRPTIGPRTRAYVVHGEADQAEGFARRLVEGGMASATMPAMETSVVEF